ncbi:MAG: hypothetical protein PHU56_04615 [Candidatus Pacebacteria bacterium]|nr:hypothetical protein [Candidatus Paceibacterota bacterium]
MRERIESRFEPESKFSPELIEDLEKSPLLADSEKLALLLMLAGEKPAVVHSLVLKFGSEQKISEEKFIAEKNFMTDWLKRAGLFFSVKEKRIRGGVKGGFKSIVKLYDFNIARDKAALERLNHAHGKLEFGLALGYPYTAAAAFSKGHKFLMEHEDLPFDVKSSEIMDFLFFRLSKEHWHEELETVKRWSRAIKENFPDFYKKITDLRSKIDSLRSESPEEFGRFLRSEDEMAIIKKRDPRLYEELVSEREDQVV